MAGDPVIRLDGKRVVITGSSRGIGAACALLFARAGAAVLVQYRTQRAEALALQSALPPVASEHLVFGGDLADSAAAAGMFEHVRQRWGGLDCLVNNAGIWVRNPLAELDEALLQETWRVNVDASFRCAHHALPLFERAEDPNIVNLTSTAGQRGEAFYSPYAASKGAMISATKAWSSELAPRVRVNSVAPGWVDTDMSSSALRTDSRAAIEAGVPLGRVASAEDIAGPVLFLASPLARHITGEILNVNGGSVLAG